ncbi:MAG: hypothetical protein JST48_02010 [Bacteroidetes bacterium]|nr:hypothetical protein [Bacteroidota bacterium]
MSFPDFVGATGVAILLIAYFLNLTKKISAESIAYTIMNLIGAGLACLASILINYFPFIILEAAWTLVSLFSLVRLLSRKKII